LQRFELMYTPQGKPDQHVLRIPRSIRVWDFYHTYLAQSTYSNFSRSHQQSWTDPLPPEKGLPSQSTARRLTDSWDHTQFLSHNSHWSSGEKSIFCWQYVLGLHGSYHQHAISTFNTCSWGPTHRSLTDTNGGYNLGGAGLPQHSPCPSQPTVLRFSSKAPSGLKLNNAPRKTSKNQVYGNLLPSRSLLTTWPSTVAYIYA
jgi:hypothetical protein